MSREGPTIDVANGSTDDYLTDRGGTEQHEHNPDSGPNANLATSGHHSRRWQFWGTATCSTRWRGTVFSNDPLRTNRVASMAFRSPEARRLYTLFGDAGQDIGGTNELRRR